jgi:hypothetical protein
VLRDAFVQRVLNLSAGFRRERAFESLNFFSSGDFYRLMTERFRKTKVKANRLERKIVQPVQFHYGTFKQNFRKRGDEEFCVIAEFAWFVSGQTVQ